MTGNSQLVIRYKIFLKNIDNNSIYDSKIFLII